jgi:rhamnulokinase
MPPTDRDSTCLALDLGAESGRAVLGRLKSGRLSVQEIARFRNEPVFYNGGWHWDAPRLWLEIRSALQSVGSHGVDQLHSIGIDTWGVDYALLGDNGALLENPFHYRDKRTDGMMERVLKVLPAEKMYAATGIQFLPFNTLYQLYAARIRTPRLLELAEHFVTMPDLFNFWMTGKIFGEYTNASTTQFLDVNKKQWAADLLEKLGLPTRILPRLIEPGTVIGSLLPEISAGHPALSATQVIAPACHDTGSAFAAVETGRHVALISSGTWSLLGTELAQPVVTEQARQLNFTNEGGVAGTVRLLKNITGLWLLERCRRDWEMEGLNFGYEELLDQAAAKPPLQHSIAPNDSTFVLPPSMPRAIVEFCGNTGQSKPTTPGAITRCVLESLALMYCNVLESLESLVGAAFNEIRIVGGGSRNDLLNQFTADATGRRVLAGPVEATALGNLAMQMVGTGAVESLAEGRSIIARCFPPRVFEPHHSQQWEKAYENFCSLNSKIIS